MAGVSGIADPHEAERAMRRFPFTKFVFALAVRSLAGGRSFEAVP